VRSVMTVGRSARLQHDLLDIVLDEFHDQALESESASALTPDGDSRDADDTDREYRVTSERPDDLVAVTVIALGPVQLACRAV